MIKVKTKKIVLMLLIFLLLTACIKKEKIYTAGSYLGTSDGYYSKIVVEVVVDDYEIITIDVLENEEPPTLADIVFKTLPPKIIKENSADVDVVSGATTTSKALLDAVEKALEKARSLDE